MPEETPQEPTPDDAPAEAPKPPAEPEQIPGVNDPVPEVGSPAIGAATDAAGEVAGHVKAAIAVALKMYPSPAQEIQAYGKSRSMPVYLTLMLLAIVVLPLVIAVLTSFKVFVPLVIWGLIANAGLFAVLFIGLKFIFKRDVDPVDCMAIMSVTWIPLLPAAMLAPILIKLGTGNPGAIVAALGMFLSVQYMHLGCAKIGELEENPSTFLTAIGYTVFFGLFMHGFFKAMMAGAGL